MTQSKIIWYYTSKFDVTVIISMNKQKFPHLTDGFEHTLVSSAAFKIVPYLEPFCLEGTTLAL